MSTNVMFSAMYSNLTLSELLKLQVASELISIKFYETFLQS